MVTHPGDIFVFPLVVRTAAGDRATGYFGAAQTLAVRGEEALVGALEHLETTPELASDTPLLELQPVDPFPHRAGEILVTGSSLPDGWQQVGRGEISGRKLELSEAFHVWKNPSASVYDAQSAYARLRGVSVGLEALRVGLTMAWRVRFELEQLVQEQHEQRARAADMLRQREASRTWQMVAAQKVGRGLPPSFAKKVQRAFAALITRCEVQPSQPALEQALVAFFETLAADKHTSEYRDELARLAVDVATRRGGTEELALRLAERSLS